MATIQERHGSYRILFLYRGKRHTFTLGEVEEKEAQSKADHVDYLLMRLKQGLLQLPPDTDIVDFMQSDGKIAEKVKQKAPEKITFKLLEKKYLEAAGISMERNSLETVKMHLRHFKRSLGEQFPMQELGLDDLQAHVTRRKGRSPVTIRKEMASLRAVWNWGVQSGRLKGALSTFASERSSPA